MNALLQVVDGIEQKISLLLRQMELLKQANEKLSDELATCRQIREEQEAILSDWKEKYKALQLTYSMLGSKKNKAEAGIKINALIREIDWCIAQLSE